MNPRGTDTVAMTVSCGSSSIVTFSIGANVGQPEDVTDLHVGDVDLDVLRHVGRQRLDVHLTRDQREHPARLDACRLADELHDDGRMDRLVEPHLAKIDVRDRSANRILLVLREDRRMDRRLALDHDVEDRVQSRGARHGRPQLALGDDDRARVALPVEHAGNEPLRAQAPGLARAEFLALAHFELQPVSGHGGGL